MTVARLWRAAIAEEQAQGYETFAREYSLPMFRAQPGFEGVLMMRRKDECLVLTLWEDASSADALQGSAAYLETVAAIRQAGFLRGEQTLELLEVHLSDLR